MTEEDRRQSLERARVLSGLTVQELWLRYIALGGAGDAFDVDAHLQGVFLLPTFEQDVLAHAVNEHLMDLYRGALVPLSTAPTDRLSDSSLSAVISDLLNRRPSAPPAGPAAGGEPGPRG